MDGGVGFYRIYNLRRVRLGIPRNGGKALRFVVADIELKFTHIDAVFKDADSNREVSAYFIAQIEFAEYGTVTCRHLRAMKNVIDYKRAALIENINLHTCPPCRRPRKVSRQEANEE